MTNYVPTSPRFASEELVRGWNSKNENQDYLYDGYLLLHKMSSKVPFDVPSYKKKALKIGVLIF